jgi:eukaryotic-like serine/threonine-protein kinase
LLSPGTKIGPYEIFAAIGAGGMGEVYRARDTRLGRDVAIKVLPPEVATEAGRLRRFELEARAVAQLNHPNILAVHDIGHMDSGAPYMVTELLEGQTLRSRLDDGPVTNRAAVDYAIQIARGLSVAHDKHLVHRDLKPANIFITTDNGVKILDFGLAKLVGPADAVEATSAPDWSLTRSVSPATEAGLVLGTVGYMAPEQVRALPTDHRADIFALGTVLYEMLTGHRAFEGDTAADVMTAVLTSEPRQLPEAVRQAAPALGRIVDRCLAKDAGARFASASDLIFALESLSSSSVGFAPSALAVQSVARRRMWTVAAAGLLAGILMTTAILAPRVWRSAAVDDTRLVRLQLTLPTDLTPVRGQPPAMSPDGDRVALVGIDQASGMRQIYLRPLNSVSAQSVRGTDRAIYPFWSADGARMGFFADGRLKTVDLATGTVQDICAAPNPAGPGIWVDDTIIFPRNGGPLHRVSASGGTSVPATTFDARSEVAQSVAGFLADRRRFVFGTNAYGTSTLRIASIDDVPGAPVSAPGSRGWLHAPWLNPSDTNPGHFLFLRGSVLFAVAFDGSSGQAAGEPVSLAQAVAPLSSGAAAPFSVQDGVLAYVGNVNGSSRLMWMNRKGETLGSVGPVSGFLRDVRVAPDGLALTVSRYNDTDRVYDLMLMDLRRPTASQLTFGTSAVQSSWLPDRSAIVFSNVGTGGSTLVRMAPQEGAAQVPVLPSDEAIVTLSEGAPDGQSVAYVRIRPDGDADIYLHSLSPAGADRPFLATPAFETAPRFSPDGAWVAYQSNETGVPEVFIRSFPSGTDKLPISRGGGYRPVWGHDGHELFYLSGDGDLMSVAVTVSPSLAAGTPERLFRTPIDPGNANVFYQFDTHPDGRRFVMVVPEADAPQPFNVILNWQTLMKK